MRYYHYNNYLFVVRNLENIPEVYASQTGIPLQAAKNQWESILDQFQELSNDQIIKVIDGNSVTNHDKSVTSSKRVIIKVGQLARGYYHVNLPSRKHDKIRQLALPFAAIDMGKQDETRVVVRSKDKVEAVYRMEGGHAVRQ